MVRSVSFLETISNYYSLAILKKENTELFARSFETVLFVLKETDLCGVVTLLTSILLADGAVHKNTSKILP